MERFIDENLTIDDFVDVIFITCPECNKKAEVRKEKLGSFKLICEKCGLIRKKEGNALKYSVIKRYLIEDTFETSLWLQKNYKENVFFATNYEHLKYLKIYIQAKIRERKREPEMNDIKNQTMASRLPQFIKSSKNREGLLKIIESLEKK